MDFEERVSGLLWYAPYLGRCQLRFLKHNRAISQVMERSCLEHGMAQRASSDFVRGQDFNLPLHAVSVHCTPV